MKKILLLWVLSILFCSQVSAAMTYTIDVAHNDELFIIDGEKFEAKLYCLNFEEGDEVVFVEGSPYACVEAKILNLRTRDICEVWCE